MADELLFSVSSAHATPASRTTLAEAGFTERGDLQEWVIANPRILGPGVRIVTFEFDRWWSSTGNNPVDRLDVLGLDTDGRLVVAELKRDDAPDTVEMQAIKYAAMVSRFTAETLGKYHARFLSRKGEHVTEDEALEALANHVDAKALDPDLLRRPRIVLVAGAFPPVVTATAVWLREMGVDFTLIRAQAYRTAAETLVTVSQLYPVRSIADFEVGPRPGGSAEPAKPALPALEWTDEDYVKLAELTTNPTVLAILDACSDTPDQLVAFPDIWEKTGRPRATARADLAGLTQLVRRRFDRDNWPFDLHWAAGGRNTAYYQMSKSQAEKWLAARAAAHRSDESA